MILVESNKDVDKLTRIRPRSGNACLQGGPRTEAEMQCNMQFCRAMTSIIISNDNVGFHIQSSLIIWFHMAPGSTLHCNVRLCKLIAAYAQMMAKFHALRNLLCFCTSRNSTLIKLVHAKRLWRSTYLPG